MHRFEDAARDVVGTVGQRDEPGVVGEGGLRVGTRVEQNRNDHLARVQARLGDGGPGVVLDRHVGHRLRGEQHDDHRCGTQPISRRYGSGLLIRPFESGAARHHSPVDQLHGDVVGQRLVGQGVDNMHARRAGRLRAGQQHPKDMSSWASVAVIVLLMSMNMPGPGATDGRIDPDQSTATARWDHDS